MLRLLQLLIFGHVHNWKLIEKIKVKDECDRYRSDDYILQCQICGDLKKRRL